MAIRLQPDTASVFPLVQGMFCRVDIEGRALDRVFILPRTAVSFEQTVYVAEENRLRTRKVEVARAEDGTAFITGGLEEGEQVIVTRLENPLESSLLNILTSAEKVEETEAVDPLEAAQKFEENKAGEQ